MSYYVYILKSDSKNQFYTGCTNNLKRRLSEHNLGKHISTKHLLPVKLVYYEEFDNKEEARQRELYLKSGVGREERKEILLRLNKRGGAVR